MVRVGVAMAVYEPDQGYLGQQVESMRAQEGGAHRLAELLNVAVDAERQVIEHDSPRERIAVGVQA